MILASDITPTLTRLWQTGYRIAAQGFLDPGFDVPFQDAAIFAQQRSGWLVKEIDGVTRERIQQLLADVLGPTFSNPDVSPTDLADALQAEFDQMSQGRADTIARTETAYATAYGAGAAWDKAGIEQVEISDGDYDPECAAADGQVWTVDEYLANPLEHPNCTRAAYPIVDAPDDTLEQASRNVDLGPLPPVRMLPEAPVMDPELRELLKASAAAGARQADAVGELARGVVAHAERPLPAMPTPEVHVDVAPAQVHLELPAPEPALAKRSFRKVVERDDRGRITAVLEQEV